MAKAAEESSVMAHYSVSARQSSAENNDREKICLHQPGYNLGYWRLSDTLQLKYLTSNLGYLFISAMANRRSVGIDGRS